jgi:hypothetical protein
MKSVLARYKRAVLSHRHGMRVFSSNSP